MSVTIDATVGGAASNSFATAAEFAAYMNNRLNVAAYTAAAPDDQARALIEATRELNLLNYSSRKVATAQALQWPRWQATDPDAAAYQVWYFLSTVIPQRMKDATCELALEFLKAGTTDIAALDPTINVLEKSIDVIHTRYAEVSQRRKGLARFPRVWSLVAPLLDGTAGQTPIVRG